MQCHVLGVALLPIVGALLVADARSARAGPERRRSARSGWPVWRSSPLSYLPLAIHELTTDFSELRAALAYLAGGGDPATLGPRSRLLVIGAPGRRAGR